MFSCLPCRVYTAEILTTLKDFTCMEIGHASNSPSSIFNIGLCAVLCTASQPDAENAAVHPVSSAAKQTLFSFARLSKCATQA